MWCGCGCVCGVWVCMWKCERFMKKLAKKMNHNEYGGNSNYRWSVLYKSKDEDVKMDWYALVYSWRRTLQRYEFIGWIWMNPGPTSNDWREQLVLTLILLWGDPNYVTQCVVLICADFFWFICFILIFCFTCGCTDNFCVANETNARMLWPFF